MNNLSDLAIEKEILPIFDHSLNNFAKQKVLELLSTPLATVREIEERQNILKGFAKNHHILKDYSYTVLFVNEVYFFMMNEKIEDLSQQKWTYKLLSSRQKKTEYLSKINQMILFFYRLESRYFIRLDLKVFPAEYQKNIQRIKDFLALFELSKHEYIIREKKLKDKHIIAFTQKIVALKNNKSIALFWKDFFLFESYLSIHQTIHEKGFTFPEIDQKTIQLNDFYHPLLKNPIKNSFETSQNVIVLNGPNMSGKSTFLKAVALCLYLGHLGVAIPAATSKIPFINYFSVDINRKDDIQSGYSHFMSEVVNLKNVVEQANAGNNCLAVFDELFSGTNVEDGLEICKTTINGLTRFTDSYFFISTHMQELKKDISPLVKTYHIDCQSIKSKPAFTYKVKPGWSDVKIGRILFEKEGLNAMLKQP